MGKGDTRTVTVANEKKPPTGVPKYRTEQTPPEKTPEREFPKIEKKKR
jgi:hypothetical protein